MSPLSRWKKIALRTRRILVTATLAVILGVMLLGYLTREFRILEEDYLGRPHLATPRSESFESLWAFEKNKGHAPEVYQYVLRSPYFSAGFGDNRIVVNVSGLLGEEATGRNLGKQQGNSITLEFQNAKQSKLLGAQSSRQVTHSYIGNDKKRWATDIQTFKGLQQRDLYDGVQLTISARSKHLAYSFYVEPEHSIEPIKISVVGSEKLSIDDSGNLIIGTSGGYILQTRPKFFEISGNEKRELQGRYILRGDALFGFEVEGRDRSKVLVIDPEIVFATYFGGSQNDAMLGTDLGSMDFIGRGYDIQVGPDGDLHIVGRTTSLDFPVTDGGTISGFGSDMFALRIDPDGPPGARLKYAVFIGGDGEDNGRSIAVLEDSSVYITGWSATGFPVSAGVVQPARANSGAVVAKLGPDGQFLLGTYIGSASSNHPNSIVYEKRSAEPEGFIYLGGSTRSPGGDGSAGTVQSTYGGGQYDGFIVKMDLELTQYEYFTYLGGAGRDVIYDIDVNDGWVFASGTTASFDFPDGFLGESPHVHSESGNPNCDGTLTSRECADAFVARLYRDGSELLYSNYYGADREEYARGIAVSASSEAYFTGARRVQGSGISTIFVTKISASGESVDWEQTWDGTGTDHGEEISVDPFGRAHVVGTVSVEGYLTGLSNSNDYLGASEMFYARVKAGTDTTPTPGVPAPGDVEYFAYLGGIAADRGFAIDGVGSATDAFCVYPVGATVSQDVSVVAPLDGGSTNSGMSDMLLYGICDLPPDVNVFKTGPSMAGPGDPIVYTITIVNAGDEGVDVDVSDVVPASISVTGVADCSRTGNNVACTVNAGFAPHTITITADLPANACNGPSEITNTVTIDYTIDGEQRTKSASHTIGVNCPTPPVVCGDGILDPSEECEPGLTPGNLCNDSCRFRVCGDLFTDEGIGEQCDPPGQLLRCNEICRNIAPYCGDYILDPYYPFYEECDDGNNTAGDGCRPNCKVERCGDGIRDPQDECDDGNNTAGDGCRANCTVEWCGDGIRDPQDECDRPGDDRCENCKNVGTCGDYCTVPWISSPELCGSTCPVCQRTFSSADPGTHWECFLFICWPVANDPLNPLYGRCRSPGSPEIIYD